MEKISAAKVKPVRQRAQYTCMAASLSMCMRALGVDMSEDDVAEFMGVDPTYGGTWESTLATATHFGIRVLMTAPTSLKTVKRATDSGYPVMITWNPEGREWSHASVVFNVSDDMKKVYVADPNIPDPEQRVRIVDSEDFYRKWGEKWPNFIFRRVAVILSREVDENGDQTD